MKTILIYIFLFISTIQLCSSQTLDDYYQIAAENNPGLQAKYKAFEAAMERVQQVKTLPDPTISFGYFISPVETRVGPQRARFSLNQMFPWFGSLKAAGEATALQAEAKYQSFIDARNKLYYQLAEAYYPLYELNRWKQIERENIEILRSYKSIANSKYENSKGSMVDVLRVDIMLRDAETNLSILEQKEKPLTTAFNNLLNRPEDKEVDILDSLSADTLASNYRRDSLLTNHPALNAFELKIESTKASELAAKKQGLPKFGVGLDYVVVDERQGVAMEDNGKDAIMPMVSLSIPIFKGRYKAMVEEAQLMRESYTYEKEEYANALGSAYERSSFTIEQQLDLIDLYNRQIRESKRTLRLLFSAYSNGGEPFEEVLRMQQQLLKYQKLKATALVEYQIAVEELNYITAKNR